MRYLVAVDPGIRGVGLAVLDNDSRDLQFARYVKSPARTGNKAAEVREAVNAVRLALDVRGVTPNTVAAVAVEWPQNYAAGQQKGDQNDLLPLSAVSACVGCMFPVAEVFSYLPREWKSTMRDFICAQRVVDRLSSLEAPRFEGLGDLQAAIDRARRTNVDLKKLGVLAHNTADAVGIGLKALGRFEPERVLAR